MTAELEEIFSKFPIAEVLPLIRNNFKTESIMVLQAAPGAGKTTIVPLALLDASFLNNKKIIMLEPRRLAARSAALWMSKLLDDQPGGIIGYRTRFDTKVSSHTRVEIVTEGILTRMIQDDPRLDQFGLVVFDEFHERHLNTDLGLALTLDLQSGIREDLRILLMSATLNASLLAEKLKAVMICCEGRSFPVETFYKPKPQTDYIEKHARNMVLEALDKHQGSILVFLPGVGEIRRLNRYLEESIKDSSILLAPLYGDLVQAQQDHAIQPPPQGKRKIVLATSIAETSLTIEDVNIVIDCGLSRIPAYDPASGMSRLVTVPVTKASADQRRGRAGRIRPGICYRLWSEHDQNGLLPENRPEILSVDLAGLVLELSLWGIKNPNQLFWIDEPPVPAYAEASGLLKELGAIATDGSITAHGKAMSGIGAHPRLAHMMIRAEQKNLVAEGSLLSKERATPHAKCQSPCTGI